MVGAIKWFTTTILLAIAAPGAALAADICPRPGPHSDVLPPPDVYSSGGILSVDLEYRTTIDLGGRALFCFQTPAGVESPTLHVFPGDTIKIHLANKLPPVTTGPGELVSSKGNKCGDALMRLNSVNMHFHGVNASPKCHSDESIHTIVNSGQSFDYNIKVPKNEPPGLYWYHPHVHGIASPSLQGGASGVIIVEGIENVQPAVAGLPQRVIIIRDQPLLNSGAPDEGPMPNWDVNVNYVPVPFPAFPTAKIRMQHGVQEFWRVANAGANTILDLQVVYDRKPQTLQIVAWDGVPTGSQNGRRQGTLVSAKHILLPPSGRVEFIVPAIAEGVAQAYLVTRKIDGGPASDTNPARPMAQMIATDTPVKLPRVPKRSGPPKPQRFEDVTDAMVTGKRTLYFFEEQVGDTMNFYVVVDGQAPRLFDPNDPPSIVTRKGAVEDWFVQNRTTEVHEFHMHQIHFKVLEENGKPLPKDQQQWRDTYQIGYWDGESKYPYVKMRMDFRGAVVGDFLYHCHILDHEDFGMMAIIRVKPEKDEQRFAHEVAFRGRGN